MALLFEGVRKRLAASTGVGAQAGDRIYPLSLPQNPTLPAVTYQQISGESQVALGGVTGLARARVQVDSWARSYTAARDTAEQVRLALTDYQGSTGGVVVNAVFRDRETELFEGEGDQDRLYRVSQDYTFWYCEDKP